MQAIYFDMDGTIVDLYNVEDWEAKLNSSDPSPYVDAVPMVNMEVLNELMEEFTTYGITVGVISWLAMHSDKSYDETVRKAKREWLAKYFPVATEIHLVKYGTTKRKAARFKNSVLVDDNAKVRKGWNGHSTIDATGDILTALREYLELAKIA